jgi:hypothetical protein
MPKLAPPHNEAAEVAVLGALLLDADLMEQIDLAAEDFYLKKHGIIFEAILDLLSEGLPVDFITLTQALSQRKQLSMVGGPAFIHQMTMEVPNHLRIREYAHIVKSDSIKRRTLHLAEALATAAAKSNGTLSAELFTIRAQLDELLPTADEDDADDPAPIPAHDLEIDPDLAATCGQWIDRYIDYANNASPMTPRAFHESAALWLVSSIIARRIVLNMAFDRIYPNLWFAWVAPSTLFGKSTSMNLARRVAMDVAGHLLTPEDMTPEGLMLDMAGIEPQNLSQMGFEDQQAWQERRNFCAQRAWTMDEFSGLLATAGRDYNAGLTETLMRFYDCTEEYKRLTAGRGLQIIKNSYLTLLGASTPTALASHLTDERLWGMGFWPRFALLAPEESRPAWSEPKEQPAPTALTAALRNLYARLPAARWPDTLADVPAILEPGVYDHWNAYNKLMRYELLTDDLDRRLWAAYGRLPVATLKVATILAALDWPEQEPTPRIAMPHLHRALLIVESWRSSAHRVLDLALNAAEDRMAQAVIEKLKGNARGLTLRDLYKGMKRHKPRHIERVLNELVLQGEIREIEYQNPRGGPRTKRYAIG